MPSLLVRDALVVTQDDERRILRGDVRVEDGVITHVGPEAPSRADEVMDGRGKVVMPGLVNAHTHLAMTLMRGYGDDLPLETWLRERVWPAEAKLTREVVEAGSDLGLLEMMANGITSFNDMYFFPDATAKACERAGVRAAIGATFLDFPTPELTPGDMPGFARAFIERWGKHPLVTPTLAPHATYTCSRDTLETIAGIQRETGVLLHTHCSETRFEVQEVQEKAGARPVGVLKETGLLGSRSVLAHCGWITKAEAGEIAAAGATAVHCPVSNMKLGTGGYTPLTELWAAGANVAAGTDGAASNNTLDVLSDLKFTALVEKQHRWDPSAAPAARVLDMATRGGAAALGLLETLGSIEVGKRGDLAVLDFARPHLFPLTDVVSHLVYAGTGRDVHATVVDGRVVYAAGEWRTLDAQGVLKRAEAAARRVVGDRV